MLQKFAACKFSDLSKIKAFVSFANSVPLESMLTNVNSTIQVSKIISHNPVVMIVLQFACIAKYSGY